MSQALIFISAFLLTGFLRRYALANNILDVPNHRSSHEVPTPRGGGMAFVGVFLCALVYVTYTNTQVLPIAFAFWGAGLLLAFIGFLDDRNSISAKLRLSFHLLISGVALLILGGMPALSIFSWSFKASLLLNGLTIFYLAWLINLYNFMDGINGLASIEAITVCLGGAVLYWVTGFAEYMIIPLCLAFAVSGFLCWNFPKARIFMGDAGSGFLGLALGVLSIQAGWVKEAFFWSWLILLGVFITDATITLLRRFLQGDKLHLAHKSHAYQRAAQKYKNHVPVTFVVLAINVIWLFPIALAVGLEYLNGCLGVLIAYLPLAWLALHLNAGKHTSIEQ